MAIDMEYRVKEILDTLSEEQRPLYSVLVRHAVILEMRLEAMAQEGVYNPMGGLNSGFVGYRQALIVYADLMSRIGRAAKLAAISQASQTMDDGIAAWLAEGK